MNAVDLVIGKNYSCREVARRLNVTYSYVPRWVRQHRDQAEASTEPTSQRDLEAEVKQLRKKNQRLLMERGILKNAAAIFASEPKKDSILSGSK